MLKNIAHLTHHVRIQQQVTAEPDRAQETRSAGVLILAFAVSQTESYRLLLLTRSRASCLSSVNEPENQRGRERGVHMSWGCSTAQLPLSSQGYWALRRFSSDFYVLELMKPPFSFFLPALSLSWSCRAFSISLEGTSVLTSSGTLAPLPICLGRPNCQYPCVPALCDYASSAIFWTPVAALSLLLCDQSQKMLGRAKSFAEVWPIYPWLL